MADTLIIGIAGGTGSGKSTLTKRIKEKFGDDVSVINHDSYYKDQSDLPFEARIHTNYDHPAAFDTDLLVSHLKELKEDIKKNLELQETCASSAASSGTWRSGAAACPTLWTSTSPR